MIWLRLTAYSNALRTSGFKSSRSLALRVLALMMKSGQVRLGPV